MTTSYSPLSALKAQADRIAMLIKAAERGEKIDVKFWEKIEEARKQDRFVVGIVMDDKVLRISILWTMIKSTSEVALAAYILKKMRGARDH